jgi:serine/threonine-protein kinase
MRSHEPAQSQPAGEGTAAVGAIVGEYRVDEVVGVGGMGRVVSATHVRDGRRVAIKMVLPALVDNADIRGRFPREARAAQQLTSEHAVRVFEVASLPDDTPYMVMELLHGDSLDRLAKRGPMPIADVVSYVIEACDALAEAHRLGIVHRDLKPANLFLAERPGQPSIVKVLDFGISKASRLDDAENNATSLTATGTTLGSPTYMSPEQLRNSKRVDARSDIWSLGMILHRLIAGRSAFEAESVGEHLIMIVSELPTPLTAHRPDAPLELERVLLRCLMRAPMLRFQSVGQLVTALAPFASPRVMPIVERVGEPIPESLHRSLSDLTTMAVVPGYQPGANPALATQIVENTPLVAGADQPTVPAKRPAPGGSPAGGPRADDAPASGSPGESSTLTAIAQGAPPSSRHRGLLAGALATSLMVGILAFVWIARPPNSPAGTLSTQDAERPAASKALPSPATPPGADSDLVTVTVQATPATATLELDGAKVRELPLRLPRGQGEHRLTGRAPGYEETTILVTAGGDSSVTLVLPPAGAGSASASAQPTPPPTAKAAAAPTQAQERGDKPSNAAAPTPSPSATPTATPSVKLKGPVETSL